MKIFIITTKILKIHINYIKINELKIYLYPKNVYFLFISIIILPKKETYV